MSAKSDKGRTGDGGDRENNFRPAWWLKGGHLQTLWQPLMRRRPRPTMERERFELWDGDFVDVDWLRRGPKSPISLPRSAPTVLLLHGLEGSSQSPYIRGLVHRLAEYPWQIGVVHFRSCSGEPNRLPRAYHSGDTGDLAWIAESLQARGWGALVAVGFSLGGNALLKWLGESGSDNPLSGAVAVSVPLLLDRCADRLENGVSQFYQWWLLRTMKAKVRDKQRRSVYPPGFPKDTNLSSFRRFDHAVTAPLHGFASAADYYNRCSARQYLSGIVVPTLMIQAQDDPFMYADVIPERDEVPSAVRLEVQKHGGHVGFVSGQIPGWGEYWLEERIPKFVESVLT